MRISAKGRYALAAVVNMAQRYDEGEFIPAISISENLGISKIYLEQVFTLLKKSGIVVSTKGAQGGYKLTQTPSQITVLDVLVAVEVSLFEQTQETVSKKAPEIEKALRLAAFDILEESMRETLEAIPVSHLVNEAKKHKDDDTTMFYI